MEEEEQPIFINDHDEALDFLDTCIETFVLLQYGLIPFSCANCSPKESENLKCTKLYQEGDEPVWFCSQNKMEYYCCPLTIIPNIVYEWYDRYLFDKEFNTQRSPGNTEVLYWFFVKSYKRHIAAVEHSLQEKRMAELKKKNKGT